MWNKRYILFILLLLSFCFSACRSSKNVIEGEKNDKDVVQTTFSTFNAKCDISIFRNEAQSFRVGGDLRIKKDSLIILSIQPFAGVEMGRLSCSKEGIVLLDRINKRYFAFDFKELKDTMNAAFSYEAFESILLGEIFTFGEEKKTQITDFSKSLVGNMVMLQRTDEKLLQEYILNDSMEVQSGVLQEESYRMRWTYANLNKNDVKSIPMKIEITFSAGVHTLGKLGFDYKRVEFNNDLNFSSNIPANYKKVSYIELLKMIAN